MAPARCGDKVACAKRYKLLGAKKQVGGVSEKLVWSNCSRRHWRRGLRYLLSLSKQNRESHFTNCVDFTARSCVPAAVSKSIQQHRGHSAAADIFLYFTSDPTQACFTVASRSADRNARRAATNIANLLIRTPPAEKPEPLAGRTEKQKPA